MSPPGRRNGECRSARHQGSPVSPIARALDDLRALDALAARETALARVDPRAKLVATLAFIVCVLSFDRYSVAAMLPLALYPTVLAARGEVPLRLLRRVLVSASPFALMVGIFNPLFDRAAMLDVAGVQISGGWVSFAAIALRFALTVSAALALVAGTGMPALCSALARLGVARVFTVQLMFLYRYTFVLAGEAARMTTARSLRAGEHSRMRLAVYASLLGQLLLRAFERAQRIHQAMLARGFDGALRLADRRQWKRTDSVFVAAWCAFFVCVRAIDLPRALGALIGAVAP
jgi:cobalt/nickel transport system permease protein